MFYPLITSVSGSNSGYTDFRLNISLKSSAYVLFNIEVKLVSCLSIYLSIEWNLYMCYFFICCTGLTRWAVISRSSNLELNLLYLAGVVIWLLTWGSAKIE